MNLEEGSVYLDGHLYDLDPESWDGKDVVDFSPKASTPGAGVVYSDLQMYQPIAAQTDFTHGFGFIWQEDEAGYMYTAGSIDTRQKGQAMLMTQKTQSDDANVNKYNMVVFGAFVYAATSAGVYRTAAGASWEKCPITGTTEPKINAVFTNGAYLFALVDGARLKKASAISAIPTTTDWSDAGVNSGSTDYKWAVMHAGYQYFGKDASNIIYKDSNADLSALCGAAADDTAEIYVGTSSSMVTLGAISFLEKLMVARQDGLWGIGDDNVARLALNFSGESSASNFRSMCVHNGMLYFPIRDRLYQWNGSRLNDVTPPQLTDTWPYVTLGYFNNLVSHEDLLYCTARTNESNTTYDEMVLAYDGVGWHRIISPITAGVKNISMMSYDSLNNYLWYHVNNGTTDNTTSYIPFQDYSHFPEASFATSGTHSLYTSRIHAGYRKVTKSVPRLIVEGKNLSSTRYISVYFNLDGTLTSAGTALEWVKWDDVTVDGVTTLTFPGGERTQEFDYMQLRFDFCTADAPQTPILEGYTLMGMMRPDTKWGYSFAVLVENKRMKANLRKARNSKKPVLLVTPLEEEIWGYVTSLNETGVAPGETKSEMEALVRVNFVETLDSTAESITSYTEIDRPSAVPS
jgi:hypothetical protein